MNCKNPIKQKLIDNYLEQYKCTPKHKRASLFDQLLEQARIHDIPDLISLFEGYLLYEKKSYKESINKFNVSLKSKEVRPYAWNGIGNVYADQKAYEKAKEAYHKAIAADSKFSHPWNALGYILASQKKYAKARRAYRKAIALDVKFAYPWNGLGNVYSELRKHHKAEVAYRKAIALDEKFGHPWNGLGNVYSEAKDYGKAEEAYRKAIEVDGDSALPWNGLGIVYAEQKDYSKAEDAYRKAIALDKESASPWNGLGVVYFEREDYSKAEDAYRKAIALDANATYALHNLGSLYFKLNKAEDAAEYFKKAHDSAVGEKDLYLASVAENNLNVVLEKAKENKAIVDVRKISKSVDFSSRVLSGTANIENEVFANQKSFQSFVVEPSGHDDGCTYLKVLRRWNSYTPIVSDNYYIGKGGGYFLKIGKKGIVIDPGFNFIDNFKRAGHTFDDIDVVMISHAHNDHTSDLESILTLLNKCNKRRKGVDDVTGKDTVRADIAKNKGIDIGDVSEEEIEKVFIEGSPRRKKLDLYLTKSVEKKFGGMLTSFKETDYEYHVVEKNDVKQLLGGAVKVMVIEAKHDDIVSDRDSVGFVFDFHGTVLIYTGDTGWDDRIEKQYVELQSKHKGKNIVLLAHIGGFKDYENKYLLQGAKSKAFYKNHLGRLGLCRLVETLKPAICFISEFGEEMRKHRENVAEVYNGIFNKTTLFIPADIGLEYHIKVNKIRAITQLNLDEYDYITDLITPRHVKTCLLRKDYSLHYFDGAAKLKESDLVQILSERFDRSSK